MSTTIFERRPTILIARVRAARLDHTNIDDLAAQLRRELAQDTNLSLLLDFAEIGNVAEEAITPLILLHAELRSRYQVLVLFNLGPQVREFFEATKMDQFLSTCTNEASAIELVGTKPMPAQAKGERPAYYMKFVSGHHGSLDRIGGLPTHLPPQFPMTTKEPEPSGPSKKRRRNKEPVPVEMQPMAFTAQFYCTPERLNLPGVLCVQIYQADPGDDPTPAAILVPPNAPENTEGLGRINTEVNPHDVEWEQRMDPETRPENVFDPVCRALMDSKIGGTTFFQDAVTTNETFLLQIRDDRLGQSHGVNFGGFTLIAVADAAKGIQARLG